MDDRIEFTDIHVDDAILDSVTEVLESKRYVKGPEVEAFEEEFAAKCGTDHAIGVSSGTAAILLSLQAADVGPGDDVLVPGHTFFATVSPVLSVGANPVFVDVDPDRYTMDPGDLRRAIDRASDPSAVLPVHLYGQPAAMDEIADVADAYDLYVLEDACQAHFATLDGRPVGTLGDAGAFSFYPSKNMTVGGDGGMIVTDDPGVASEARALRNHGRDESGAHVRLGLNYRMDEINGAVGRHQLDHVQAWNEARAAAARRYTDRLEGVAEVVTPAEAESVSHVYHLYVIQVPDRDALGAALDESGVDTGVHYPTAAHRHPAIRERTGPAELEVSERLTDRILSLPMHPRITDEEIDRVCTAIEAHYK